MMTANKKSCLPHSLRRLLKDLRGITAVEFALVFPILLGIGLGVIEIGRFTLLNMKLEQAANTIADLGTRDQNLSAATLNDLFAAVEHILDPFEMGSAGLVIVSGVVATNGGAPEVAWQGEGAGSLPGSSTVGEIGETATIPESIVMVEGETLVIAEVFFQYNSWLLGMIGNQTMHRAAFYRPRMGTLQTLS